MLRVLDPIEDAKVLHAALRKHRATVYYCEDCGYPWIKRTGKKRPRRCANMDCRAGADIPKRHRPGRPAIQHPD